MGTQPSASALSPLHSPNTQDKYSTYPKRTAFAEETLSPSHLTAQNNAIG